jgi:hypothetical protein
MNTVKLKIKRLNNSGLKQCLPIDGVLESGVRK